MFVGERKCKRKRKSLVDFSDKHEFSMSEIREIVRAAKVITIGGELKLLARIDALKRGAFEITSEDQSLLTEPPLCIDSTISSS